MDIISLINKSPKNFCVVQALERFYGSVIYRIIAGSSKEYVWDKNMGGAAANEDLNPLEWPHLTEGSGIYTTWEYATFVQQHLMTDHISISLLEKIHMEELRNKLDKNKILVLKSHDMDLDNVECKIVRVIGDLIKVTDFKNRSCMWRAKNKPVIEPIYKNNVHNLVLQNLLSSDFNIFLDEYLKLIHFLDCKPNINNVRQYLLLSKDKLTRYNDLVENN